MNMQVSIFDVAHGSCAYVITDAGNNMLIDCADSTDIGFSPARYLTGIRCARIQRFFPLNYDEDHLRGLPELRKSVPIQVLHRNPWITPQQLRAIKQEGGPLGPGVAALLGMLEEYTGAAPVLPEQPNVYFQLFWNKYPDFTDTNNLSQVLFLHLDGTSIVFPGDMETAGWYKLLEDPAFRTALAKVTIFVASHHGRESGYCPEVFDLCKPAVVIISDEQIQYDTQQHSYDDHAAGIHWGNQGDVRRVLTTRKDGTLTITKQEGQPAFIRASKG
jgi:beta-lactamase superfamily II metal-dependent hydrolase